jgi:single-strand DNA-binding protein
MNSFTLTAVGNLARNPEFVTKNDTSYARFCLVGNDYAGKDEGGAAREVTTSLWFVAFGAMGEALARNVRKGDQLFVEAHVRANNWTDKQGEKQYDHSFVVDSRSSKPRCCRPKSSNCLTSAGISRLRPRRCGCA